MSAVLVIAGVDSSGGAGLARDLRTLARFGLEALCAVTAMTVQSERGVGARHVLPSEVVAAAIQAALATRRITAIKIGMLGDAAVVRAVAAALPPRGSVPLVLDPVLAASAGGELLDAGGRRALIEELLPHATLFTPNIPEAAALLGAGAAADDAGLIAQARQLRALGAAAVLIKGGHGEGAQAVDYLVSEAQAVRRFAAARLDGTRRGTGCALATAIAAGLATGLTLEAAIARAKQHIAELFESA